MYNFDRVTAATGVGHKSSSSVVAAVAARPYFLFVNYYWCCRGDASTYEIRVGRAAAPTAPPTRYCSSLTPSLLQSPGAWARTATGRQFSA